MKERPELAIIHFALWATVAAIYLGLLLQSAPDVEPTSLGGARLAAIAMFAGAAISMAIVVVYRKLASNVSWSTAPGEWLGFLVGTSLAADAIANRFGTPTPLTISFLQSIGCLTTLVPTLSRRLSRSWKRYFIAIVCLQSVAILITVNHNWTMLGEAREVVQNVQFLVGLAIPVVLAIVECKSHYGWMHWAGVCSHSVWLAILFSASSL